VGSFGVKGEQAVEQCDASQDHELRMPGCLGVQRRFNGDFITEDNLKEIGEGLPCIRDENGIARNGGKRGVMVVMLCLRCGRPRSSGEVVLANVEGPIIDRKIRWGADLDDIETVTIADLDAAG